MTLHGKQGILTSTTVQGAVIAGLPAVEALLIQMGLLEAPLFTQALSAVVSAAGALLAIWGRIKATKSIGGLL